MSRTIVLSLVQFDFCYRSAIIAVDPAFILGVSASKSSPINAISDLQVEM